MPLLLFISEWTTPTGSTFKRGEMPRLDSESLSLWLIEQGIAMNVDKIGCPIRRTVKRMPVEEFLKTLNKEHT